MTHVYSYTELDLRRLKGQVLKDVWHVMIGKPAGLKNTTGLKNSEEIIQAILEKQSGRGECLSEEIRPIPVEASMPQKATPKPQKEKAAKKKEMKSTHLLAIESLEEPLEVLEVIRRIVQPKTIEGQDYYVEKESNNVYTIKTGEYQGVWNQALDTIQKTQA